MHKAKLMFASAVTAAALAAGAAFANDPVTVADGVYSEAQAERGEPLYNQHCAACHNAEFYVQSLNNRVNQPASWMFEEILGTMPMNAPGFLPDQHYEDIFAYILKVVGFPAGEEDLRYAGGGMNNIRLVAP